MNIDHIFPPSHTPTPQPLHPSLHYTLYLHSGVLYGKCTLPRVHTSIEAINCTITQSTTTHTYFTCYNKMLSFNDVHSELILEKCEFIRVDGVSSTRSTLLLIVSDPLSVICSGTLIKCAEYRKYTLYTYSISNISTLVIGTFKINTSLYIPSFLYSKYNLEIHRERLVGALHFLEEYLGMSSTTSVNLIYTISNSVYQTERVILMGMECVYKDGDLSQLYKYTEILYRHLVDVVLNGINNTGNIKESWLLLGIKEFLYLHLIRKFLGENEFHYKRKLMEEEVLRCDRCEYALYSNKRTDFISPFVRMKSGLILLMVEANCGSIFMRKVLSSLLSEPTPSTNRLIHILYSITGKSHIRLFYTYLLRPGLTISTLLLSVNRKKSQVALKISHTPSSLLPNCNRRQYGLLSLMSIEADSEYEHLFDFYGNTDFSNPDNHRSENTLKFTYHVRTKRLRGAVSTYLSQTNQTRESNEIPFLYIRPDAHKEVLGKYKCINIKGGLKEALEDRSIYLQVDSIGAIEGILSTVEEEGSSKSKRVKLSDSGNSTVELLDSLGNLLSGENVFHRIKSEILLVFSRFDFQRSVSYFIKLVGIGEGSTVIAPNNFNIDDMRVFESLFLTLYYTESTIESRSVLAPLLFTYLKYSDNGINEWSISLIVGRCITLLGIICESKYINEILELSLLWLQLDSSFKYCRNLPTVGVLNLYTLLYIRGYCTLNYSTIIKYTARCNSLQVRKAATQLLIIGSVEYGQDHIISLLEDSTLRPVILYTYERLFSGGYIQYRLPLHHVDKKSDLYLFYTGKYFSMEEYETQLEKEEAWRSSKCDRDDLMSVLKIKPSDSAIVKMRLRQPGKVITRNKKFFSKALVESTSTDTVEMALPLVRGSFYGRRGSNKVLKIKHRGEVGVALLRLSKI